jgi:hypothetical protein
MEWSVSVVGAVVVMAGLRDLFHTIWHPTRRGGLSRLVMAALWRVSRCLPARRRVAGLVGPLGMVAVVGTWALAIIVGWALIYWPHMPESFALAAGLEPFERADLLDALYLSLVTVTTLGLGDIAPTAGWLRVAAPLESLVGFVLLTATVAWVLETYPALARRRALAIRLALLSRTDPSMRHLDCALGASVVESLATEVVRVRVDFMQYAETYYFHDGEDRTSLAVMVRYAADLTEHGQTARRTDMRLTAAMLTAVWTTSPLSSTSCISARVGHERRSSPRTPPITARACEPEAAPDGSRTTPGRSAATGDNSTCAYSRCPGSRRGLQSPHMLCSARRQAGHTTRRAGISLVDLPIPAARYNCCGSMCRWLEHRATPHSRHTATAVVERLREWHS